MKLELPVGTTSKLARILVLDKTKTDGSGLTGLVFNSSSLTWYYIREGDSSTTAVTLATMTVGTWATGGFKEVDSTNMPGVYEIGIPNAAVASGAKSVVMILRGATNMADVRIEIELTATSNQDATRGGMTALPNANAEAAGGLFTRGTGAGQINQPANGQIDANVKAVNADTTAPANLANTFNGTGYAAATAPAQQQQVANIAVTGAPLNQTAASATYTTGTSTGGVANTKAVDSVYDAVAASGNAIDIYYQFDLSGTSGGTAVSARWIGYLVGTVNTLKVYAYNWGGASWDQIGTVVGIGVVLNGTQDFDLTSAHTGTGGNIGLVRIRFQATGLVTATLNTDQILVGFANVITPPTNFSSMSIDGSGNVSLSSTTENAIADSLLDRSAGVETGMTVRQALRVILSAMAGKVSGGGTVTVTFRDTNDSKNRIVATVDGSANRTAITLDTS